MNKLLITTHPHGYDVQDSSPQNISASFIGRSYEEVEKQISLLFAFCGQAHKAAFQAASNRTVSALWKQDYQKALLWRFCVDWPRFIQMPPNMSILKDFIKGQKSYEESLSLVFNERKSYTADIYRHNPAAYAIYKQAQEYEGVLFAGEYGVHTKYELKFPPIMKRFMSQIYDSFFYQQNDFIIKYSNQGEAYVPTARGLLYYKLRYVDDKITECQITSPTDVHFSSLSAFTQRGHQNDLILAPQLRLEVLGLDPCKEWEVR
ncbi:MAG: hypothetical protein ACK5MJ_03645 [Alphaproteobacteria bacterium]